MMSSFVKSQRIDCGFAAGGEFNIVMTARLYNRSTFLVAQDICA